MELWQAAVLGIIQGLTEFLPVSSSGHLVLFQNLFGLNESMLTFDVMVHLGTLVAVFIAYWHDIVAIISKPWQRLTLLLIVGTIPTGLMGLFFKPIFESFFTSVSTVGVGLVLTGAILWISDTFSGNYKTVKNMSYFDAALIGLIQGLAITPGVSRSGSTVFAALWRGLDREAAARFSFLLSIPAILGAAVIELKDVFAAPDSGIGLLPLLVGTIMSIISGYLAIRLLLLFINLGRLKVFSLYVWVLALIIFVGNYLV